MAMTYLEIWKALSADDRLKAAEAFWADGTVGPQQQAALQLLAKRYSFRPKTLKTLSGERKAKMLVELPLPGDIIMLLLAAFHLKYRKQMLVDFLDTLEIPHKDGFLAEDVDVAPPSPEAVAKGVEVLKAKYPPRDVEIYLETLHMQDPEFWKGLGTVISHQ
jgi:hypothetical protein